MGYNWLHLSIVGPDINPELAGPHKKSAMKRTLPCQIRGKQFRSYVDGSSHRKVVLLNRKKSWFEAPWQEHSFLQWKWGRNIGFEATNIPGAFGSSPSSGFLGGIRSLSLTCCRSSQMCHTVSQHGGFLKRGYPQLPSIYRWIFHERNHPAMGVPHDYGNPKKKSRCPLGQCDTQDSTAWSRQCSKSPRCRHSNPSGKVALPTIQTPELSTRTGPAEWFKKTTLVWPSQPPIVTAVNYGQGTMAGPMRSATEVATEITPDVVFVCLVPC